MKMKVELNEKRYNPIPKLMESKFGGTIILAIGSCSKDNKSVLEGFVLSSTKYPIGYSKNDFDADEFIDFEGSITLSNE